MLPAQPLHGASDSPTRGGQGAETGGYEVQSTYFPAASAGYAPPPAAHDDPFAHADNGYAPSSSAEHQHVPEVVPAAVPGHSGAADTVLHFQGAKGVCAINQRLGACTHRTHTCAWVASQKGPMQAQEGLLPCQQAHGLMAKCGACAESNLPTYGVSGKVGSSSSEVPRGARIFPPHSASMLPLCNSPS